MRAALVALALALSAEGAVNFGKLAEQLESSEREQRREASWQLRTVGPQAKAVLPQLIKALEDNDSQVFANAIAAIAEIGPDAKAAIPALMGLLDSRKGRGFRQRDRDQALLRAAFALSRIGAEALPGLIAALKSEDTSLRRGATKALGLIGATAKDGIPSLIENLGHGEESLRADAVEALALIGDAAVGPLISSLGWPDPRLREGSAKALGELGSEAEAAGEPLLRAAAEEKETPVLAAIILALPKIRIAPEKSVPVLIRALCDSREAIQRAAVDAFVLVRQPEKLAVPEVVKLLDGPNATRAAVMLGHFGIAASSAAPALLAAAKRTAPPAKDFLLPLTRLGPAAVPVLLGELVAFPIAEITDEQWVVLALTKIGGAAVPALEKELASPHAAVRLAAVKVLGSQGSAARSVQSAVLKLAGDAEPLVRSAVLAEVSPLGIPDGRVIELITNLIKDPSPQVRCAAAEAAGAMGSVGRPLADELTRLIADSDSAVRIAAMKSIGAIGGGKDAAKLLADHLSDVGLRTAALDALVKLGPASAPAVPAMIAMFPNTDSQTRIGILDVFAIAGAAAALPLIEGELTAADEATRRAAIAAFCQLQQDKSAAMKAAVAALKDSARSVRETAAVAIARVSEQASEKGGVAVRPLIEVILAESDHRFAMDALRTLRVRDTATLSYALSLENDDIRMWAAEKTGKLGRAGTELLPELEKLRASSDDGLRNAARRAMDAIRR